MAGEASEVHLRGDDVLSKCQTCGTLYMGPPLGHVRDPNKQTRFVEAELTALLQAAGGTLPVIKKNEKGVYVMIEAGAEAAPAKPAPPPAPPAAKPVPASTPATEPPPVDVKPVAQAVAPKPPVHKPGAAPNRELFKRSSYSGVADTGPVAGESFAEKCERLKKVVAGAKQRAEQGGPAPEPETLRDSSPQADLHRPAAEAQAATGSASAAPLSPAAATASPVAGAQKPAELAPDSVAPAATHKPGAQDRNLMRRSTYCGVVDTGPVPGESLEDKIARLSKVAAAAKQRADEGGK